MSTPESASEKYPGENGKSHMLICNIFKQLFFF
jgi:hypothetical protein